MDETKTRWRNVERRSDRGLSIAGTRITLYTIMDHLKAGWSPEQIRDWYELTDEQVAGALDYIEANRDTFEAEYRQVLEEAEIVEQYWRALNREHLKRVAQLPPPPGQEAAWLKLQERKKRWRSK